MTLHAYTGRVYTHAGVRYRRKLKSAIPRRCLVLRDASCDFRDVANRYAKLEITWSTIYQIITELWLPYLLCARPSETDTDWPLVVSLDSRPHYVKERDYVQKKRSKLRERYASLEEALAQDKINVEKFLNTPGGHLKLMELYIQNTDLPLLVLNERHRPVYVVNTRQVPSFLRHPSLQVPQFEPATEFGPYVNNCLKSLVQWPGKGPEDVKFGYISENDTFLVFVASLAKEMEPDLEVCIVGRDGDYVLVLLLADLNVRHVWPDSRDNVIWFDIGRILELIPWGIRPSLAMWLYLTGSDFSEKLVFAPPETLITSSLAVFLRVYQVNMDTSPGYVAAVQALIDEMCFVNPFTWEFDGQRFLAALKCAMNIPQLYYEKKLVRPKTDSGAGDGGGDVNGEDGGFDDCGVDSVPSIVACPVLALHPVTRSVVQAMLEYTGTKRELSKGTVRKAVKRNRDQLEKTPDLEQFTQATCEEILFVVTAAYKAAGHYAQRCIAELPANPLSPADFATLLSFA